MSYLQKFTQNVVTDPNNSSTGNLAQNAFFIGTPTSTLGVAGIQVCFKSDQNCTIWIDQSIGATTGVGTVTTTAASATITGSVSTKFTRDFKVGDQIMIAGETTHYILSITSDTVMTATTTFSGAVGAAYTFYPWDQIDQYTYIASTGNFGITIQAVNAYERVRVTNIGSTTTAVFRLETVLCPVVEALPRSLDENGNLKVAMGTDDYAFDSQNTPQGEQRIVEPVRLAGVSYDGNTIDPNFIVSGASGTGASVTQAGQLIIASGTANAARAYVYTVRKARYVGGCCNRYRGIKRIDAGTANNTRTWGVGLISNYLLTISSATVVAGDIYTNNSQMFTIFVSGTVTSAVVYGTGNPGASTQTYTRVSGTGPSTLTGSTFTANYQVTDGCWFQYSGTTFGIRVMAGGALVTGGTIDTGSFNGNLGASYTPTGSSVATYEIYYTNSTVIFAIGNIILHTFTLPSGLYTNSKIMHAFADSLNSGTATSVSIYSRSATIYRLGKLETERKYFNITTAATNILKYGPGRLYNVIVNDNNQNAGTVTIYDGIGAAGPKIATIGTVKSAATISPAGATYDIPFNNGLTIVNSLAQDITVSYE